MFIQACASVHQEERSFITKSFNPILVQMGDLAAPGGFLINTKFSASINRSNFYTVKYVGSEEQYSQKTRHATVFLKINKAINYEEYFNIAHVWVISCNTVHSVEFTVNDVISDESTEVIIHLSSVPEFKHLDFLKSVVEIRFKDGFEQLIGDVTEVHVSM